MRVVVHICHMLQNKTNHSLLDAVHLVRDQCCVPVTLLHVDIVRTGHNPNGRCQVVDASFA